MTSNAPSASPEPFHFVRQGRSLRAGLTLAALWLALAMLYLLLEAHPAIIGLLTLTTLLALRDVLTNRKAGMTLDEYSLSWFSGPFETRLQTTEIAAIRLDTRLDFTIRLTCLTQDGQRLRAPIEATPPAEPLETALKARNIPVTRHHFSLTG